MLPYIKTRLDELEAAIARTTRDLENVKIGVAVEPDPPAENSPRSLWEEYWDACAKVRAVEDARRHAQCLRNEIAKHEQEACRLRALRNCAALNRQLGDHAARVSFLRGEAGRKPTAWWAQVVLEYVR